MVRRMQDLITAPNAANILDRAAIKCDNLRNLCGEYMYIHERKEWPEFKWDQTKLAPLLAEARHLQGRLLGRMEGLGFQLREEATLQTLTQDVVKTSEIEGEELDFDTVRSSIARRMG